MRILAVSNLYPPHYIGGYELGCQRVMDELRRRGHETSVLTTTYGVDQPTTEGPVHRLLCTHLWSCHLLFVKECARDDLWQLGRAQRADSRTLQGLLAQFRPDVVTVWNIGGLPSSLLDTLYSYDIPKVHAISDVSLRDYLVRNPETWVAYWQHRAGSAWRRGLKYMVRAMVSRFVSTDVPRVDWRNAFFTSKKLRQLYADDGLPVRGAEVIYWGVPTEQFRRNESPRDWGRGPLRLLYAGQLEEQKGVHTLLEALPLLTSSDANSIRISIAGRMAPDHPYHQRLRGLAAALNGRIDVAFLGHISAPEMPGVMQAHDVLVFPSIFEEPFSIVVLEAMAAGLPVVGTTTGGSAELLQEGVNSLTFQAGDAHALASQLHRLIDDPSLRLRLATAGQRQVEEQFSLSAKVDEIEALLRKACASTLRKEQPRRANAEVERCSVV